MKILVLLLLLGIILILFRGLSAVLRPGGDPTRAVRSLTVRVGLSIGLFLLLVVGALCGWWRPHHL
ncbi:twin transmembrane helix small protein [Paludibacterium paludis]|uniref:twin transmembrane helix small protein n=1 Tax=Paludibacterium paludis TaxID=1225769 RepID=UPI00167B8F91|nr:twin transmembrane helix small protein [Paludibacterium paludis]